MCTPEITDIIDYSRVTHVSMEHTKKSWFQNSDEISHHVHSKHNIYIVHEVLHYTPESRHRTNNIYESWNNKFVH